jgi:hypothetical protein
VHRWACRSLCYVYLVFFVFLYETNTRYNQDSGTPIGAQSGHNTRDTKNRKPITPKLIMTSYCKSTIDNVYSAMDSLIKCVA